MEAAGSWGSWERNDFWRRSLRREKLARYAGTDHTEARKQRQTGEQRGGTGIHLTQRAEAAQPEEDSAGGGARGSKTLCTPAASRQVPCIPLFLSSPGNCRRKEGYRWAPRLFPAPLADMAADELSRSLLGSPAARVEQTPLPSRPASLCAPLPAGQPETAEHRARAAREEAQRADNHRVHSLYDLSPHQATHSPPASAPGRKRK